MSFGKRGVPPPVRRTLPEARPQPPRPRSDAPASPAVASSPAPEPTDDPSGIEHELRRWNDDRRRRRRIRGGWRWALIASGLIGLLALLTPDETSRTLLRGVALAVSVVGLIGAVHGRRKRIEIAADRSDPPL